jgi:hypothetical protein
MGQGEQEHQPDQRQHDAVGFAVVLEKTRASGHSHLLHVVWPNQSEGQGGANQIFFWFLLESVMPTVYRHQEAGL